VATVPLSALLLGCDAPRGGTEVTAQPPTVEPQAIPAGGLPPRADPPAPKLATFETADAAYRAGQFAEAKGLFAGYLATKPEHGFGYYMLGLSAWKSGDLRAAAKAFDRSIGIDSSHQKSYLNSARVLLDLNRDQEALERAERALAIDSTSAEANRVLARAQSKLGHVDDAIASYRRALVIDEQDLWSLNNLGMLYLELGDPDAALGPLARAVQLSPNAPVFQNNLGMALEQDGYPVAAKEAYQAAVRADSSYHKAKTNLDRISPVVGDSAFEEHLSLKKVADLFRLEIGMWRDSAVKPVPVSEVKPVTPDSVPPTNR
jgi:tetratricopeptide (TPR) repeat protein